MKRIDAGFKDWSGIEVYRQNVSHGVRFMSTSIGVLTIPEYSEQCFVPWPDGSVRIYEMEEQDYFRPDLNRDDLRQIRAEFESVGLRNIKRNWIIGLISLEQAVA